ncbi:uncharacterized protein LOC106063323 [Biomphalaria glabrata]|uniref:Uncharacterized protein LOC106063323 n=1 Tax=Biomphalaria glabrata TaxID=6526 RepID=A0A2C9LVV7_BIOGL|nr:uncharacterized protein LOC106063323 [Biomphalaria glabrata]
MKLSTGSLIVLLIASLHYQGHAQDANTCKLESCTNPENDKDPNFCSEAVSTYACLDEVTSSKDCDDVDKLAGLSASLILRFVMTVNMCENVPETVCDIRQCSPSILETPGGDETESCEDVSKYIQCLRTNIVNNPKCTRIERASAATIAIRMKLEHKECLFSELEKQGYIDKKQADTASYVYRKEDEGKKILIEESGSVEIQVCGWNDQFVKDDSTPLIEICESFFEKLELENA